MREIQLYPKKKRREPDIVRKLQFVAGGTELVAWTDEDPMRYAGGRVAYTPRAYVCAVATGAVRKLAYIDPFGHHVSVGAGPAVSLDGHYTVTETVLDGSEEFTLDVVDRHNTEECFPAVPTAPINCLGTALFFTPDSSAIIAVRNDLPSGGP